MGFDTKFFLNLDLDSSDTEDEATIQQIFQNDMDILFREGPDYVKMLKEQIAELDNLEQ